MILKQQKGKKIGIFGLGLTGCSAITALNGIAQTILCWDDKEDNRQDFISQYGTEYLVNITDVAWQKLDKIIISPGVPPSHAIFSFAKEYNILVSSDIELFIEENKDAKIVIVTGTNGKSTTTALLGHILKQAGMDYHAGGNLGLPVLSLPFYAEGYILELSSFQIDLLNNFHRVPSKFANEEQVLVISILLNITPDHLDRYGSLEEYSKSKYKALLMGDIKIIGIDSEKSNEFYSILKKQTGNTLISISSNNINASHIKQAVICSEDKLIDNFFNLEIYDLLPSAILKGKHNFENIAAAFAACRALGLLPLEIIKHIASFKGLKHRMQYLGTKGNISFYNDSKATNAISAAYSLSSLDNIFWLAGGIFKEDSLSPIDFALKKVKKAYIFGKDKILFAKYLENKVEYEICTTMKEAFALAVRDAEGIHGQEIHTECSILLAPACASYDQFKNFEDRGNQFIELYETK